LIKTPNPSILAEYKMVGIEVLNSKTDIVEGLETESDLHDSSIQRQGFDGVALDEKAVANVLEIAHHFCLIGAPQERQ
jgi:hypothetical protein